MRDLSKKSSSLTDSRVVKSPAPLSLALMLMVLCAMWTSALAAAPMVVVIDPGHGGRDHGAVCNDVSEKDVTLAVARFLRQELESRCGANVRVTLTRDGDQMPGLEERIGLANALDADLFVSLHCNSLAEAAHHTSTAQAIDGAVVFVAPPPLPQDAASVPDDAFERSVLLNARREARLTALDAARCIAARLVGEAHRSNCEVRQDRLVVLTMASVPAVLVEMDYLTNDQQATWLASDDGRRQLARAVCLAIIDHALNNGRCITLDKH